MSWTQVHLTGLSRSVDPSDEDIETMLDERYTLSTDDNILWAGPGTTLIKRDDGGCCRGFAFLSFYSSDGATLAIDRITAAAIESENDGYGGELILRAELSNPKSAKEKKKKNGGEDKDDLRDLRFRRQRKQPIRKHPVITSSDKKRTNLGNKTK